MGAGKLAVEQQPLIPHPLVCEDHPQISYQPVWLGLGMSGTEK